MTATEIRKEVSKMTIWMADAAIRSARRAIVWNSEGQKETNSQNLPEVETASSVLFCMFHATEFDIKEALVSMQEKMDGVADFPGMKYFEEFVKVLGKRCPIRLRKEDWVLARR